MSFSQQALRALRRFVLIGLSLALIHVAKPVLLPVVVAAVIALLLLPLARGLERLRVPSAVAAGLLVAGFGAATIGGVALLKDPALEWIARMPNSIDAIRDEVRRIQEPVDQVARAAQEVESLARSDDGARAPVQISDSKSLSDVVIGGTWRLVSTGAVVAVLVFFCLAYRFELYRKALALVPGDGSSEAVLAATAAVHGQLGTYMLFLSLINAGLGLAVGTIVWALGYSNPVLWGAMAALLNFVPYLGSMTGIVVIGGVGVLTLDGLAPAVIAMCGYGFLTSLEGMVISPALLGHKLSLDPVVILLGLLLMGFVWGLAGVLLTVPLLLGLKVVADHHPRGHTLSTVLGHARGTMTSGGPRPAGAEG